MNQETLIVTSFIFLRGPDLYVDWDKMEGQPYVYFTFGVCCSEVEVDCLTGDYRVRTLNLHNKQLPRLSEGDEQG